MVNVFKEKIKDLPTLGPFNSCIKCGNRLLVTLEVEPIESDYFRRNTLQKCIVQCSQCETKYISNYDS